MPLRQATPPDRRVKERVLSLRVAPDNHLVKVKGRENSYFPLISLLKHQMDRGFLL
jgi:hypothetical protein